MDSEIRAFDLGTRENEFIVFTPFEMFNHLSTHKLTNRLSGIEICLTISTRPLGQSDCNSRRFNIQMNQTFKRSSKRILMKIERQKSNILLIKRICHRQIAIDWKQWAIVCQNMGDLVSDFRCGWECLTFILPRSIRSSNFIIYVGQW